MKFREAYCVSRIDPEGGPRRLVFDTPGGNHLRPTTFVDGKVVSRGRP